VSRLPSTLRWRLALWFAGSLALVLAALGSLGFAIVRHQLLRHHDEMLQEAAAEVEAILAQQPDSEHLTPRQRVALDQIGRLIVFHEAGGRGRVFYRSPAAADVPMVLPVGTPSVGLSPGEFATVLEAPALRIYSRPFRSPAGRQGLIRVAERLGDVTAPLSSLSMAFALLAPLAIAASAAAGYWLAGRALAPVDAVTRLARDIEATSLSRRLPASDAADELARLVATFNQMIERLEASFEGMKRFTADASHELRAPLARMRGAVDVVLSRPRDPAEYERALTSIGEDVDRLRSITEDLLVLARADAGRIDLERGPVRLDVVAAEAVESASPAAIAAGIAMQVDSAGPVLVLGDERWLRQLVAGLLDNALTFAPLGHARNGQAAIVVSVRATRDAALLVVHDSGPGIPADSLHRVFERFYRGDAARSLQRGDGAGLGLAIAAWIAQAHRGTIAAENADEGGTRFVVTIPLAPLMPATA
jgi:two-component system OmpR family sensor kinase